MKRSHSTGRGTRDGEPSQRQLRVGELLRHALSEIFRRGDFRDPVLANSSITVTEVSVSPDMRNAVAFVMPLGGGDLTDVDRKELLTALARATPFLKSKIAPAVQLKRFPQLTFKAETAYESSDKVERLLRQPDVARDLASESEEEASDGA